MSSKSSKAASAAVKAAGKSSSPSQLPAAAPCPAFITTGRNGSQQIALHVTPGARADSLSWAPGGSLNLRTTCPPVDGAANADVVAQLAAALRVPKSSLAVVAGHKSRDKVVATALAPDDIVQRLLPLREE